MIEEKDVLIRVRDGIHMAARIYRPDGAGPFPTLFATSPYRYDNNTLPAQPMFLWRETGPIEWYVDTRLRLRARRCPRNGPLGRRI